MITDHLKWNAAIYDINDKKIKIINIFKHYYFAQDINKALKKCSTKEEFSQAVNSSAMYYFWSKCEYELILTPLWPSAERDSKKIDVYEQLKINWDLFIDYIWKYKKIKN